MSEIPVFDHSAKPNVGRMPAWIRQSLGRDHYATTQHAIHGQSLHTVCEEARCPNRGECWSRGTATFMLLGDTCTRACAFCAVKTGRPLTVDHDEPRRVAAAVQHMQLTYVVLTSVNRDDLADGGAGIFAATITQLRQSNPRLGIELLTPDFYRQQTHAQHLILEALRQAPGIARLVWGHNIETVPRLYPQVRKGADYPRSLQLLSQLAAQPECEVKSAMMLGLGEQPAEVVQVLHDLRAAGTTRIAIGQYLRPTRYHLPVIEYVTPEQFTDYGHIARELGFTWVKAGAMVRSSYHAEE
ncbi:MAG: lipoyl synthase [Gammaproteobacteria bacterium]|nr:lipoyl synthase [Gammaproteobacteria bacterium]